MSRDGKLMEMLTGYAASHQHPLNIFVHMIGIPTIMLGVLIPLSWVNMDIGGVTVTLGHVVMIAFFLFYLTLDAVFAIVFLVFAVLIAQLAGYIGTMPNAQSGMVAAVAFFGGYAAQFIGHAIERSMPVLVKHPIQAQLAAPFFTVVEMFKILGLRDDLFYEVQEQIEKRRALEA
ncbi:MAG: DUF962 domain-containing protein [Woeseiaceae bacterium]|jgi:uncharacterized membrane protein YGL010W